MSKSRIISCAYIPYNSTVFSADPSLFVALQVYFPYGFFSVARIPRVVFLMSSAIEMLASL